MMEESLHSLTKSLKEKYIQFNSLKFPIKPLEDDLFEIFFDLVELGPYICGIAQTFLETGEISSYNLSVDQAMNYKLINIIVDVNDISSHTQIVEYKRIIDELTLILSKIRDIVNECY